MSNINIDHIGSDLLRAFEDGYEQGKKDAVKHGKWLGQIGSGFTPGGNPVYYCSECGHIFGSHMLHPNYKYCPSCGSKMDGE